MSDTLHINSKDNVVTCLRPIRKGENIKLGSMNITASSDIPIYHKIAIKKIPSGRKCYKYGEIIGIAVTDIEAGDHVHVHNIESTRGRGDKQEQPRNLS